jgi:sarcosine oxidase subunit gamma
VLLAARAAAAAATVVSRLGRDAATGAALRPLFGADAPAPGHVLTRGPSSLIGTAPGQWLAVSFEAGAFDTLPRDLAGMAAVTDQTDARALVMIHGADAAAMLAKGLSIDLDPSVFSAGRAAATSLAHVGVLLWRSDDGPAFWLAAPRSYAGDIWRWLVEASAEFGLDVARSDLVGGASEA